MTRASVDQDGPVPTPAVERELVDTKLAGCADWSVRQRTNQPPQRSVARRLLLVLAQPMPRSPLQSESDELQIGAQSSRTPSGSLRQRQHLLNEGLARASWQMTFEPTNLQMDNHLAIGYRQISDAALVATVERFRPACTLDTTRLWLRSEQTSARLDRRSVPARERARRPSATAPANSPSTLWVAQRCARPGWFTGITPCRARALSSSCGLTGWESHTASSTESVPEQL